MEMNVNWLLFSAAVVATVGTVGVWMALKRPARVLQRRRRSQALAAAQAAYSTAEPVEPAAAGAAADPRASGLTDAERVDAMRALLTRGDASGHAHDEAKADPSRPGAPSPAPGDESLTTSPMAWEPTLPLDEIAKWEQTRKGKRARQVEIDHEHITV
jgi:hypothetical protein